MDDPVRPGEILAQKYRVDRVLGVGGMGVVVAATHLELEQRVALKFMHAGVFVTAEAMSRFQREARIAVKLRSEHVARVTDTGTLENGAPYIVMEYLEGTDLAAQIEKYGPTPVGFAAECIVQACDAIGEAHSHGVVHRDLKPANLFLTQRPDGSVFVKVLDFGISKAGHGADAGMAMTKTGALMGSPLYMSPEQMRSLKTVDARTDVWALGVILYELLTGHTPWNAESFGDLLLQVMTVDAPPLMQLRPDVPPQVAALVAGCLMKDPAARVQSVAEVANVLAPFCSAAGVVLAQRITALARRSGTTGDPRELGASAPQAPAAPPGAAVMAGTGAGWGSGTGQGPKAPGRSRASMGIVAALVVAAAVGITAVGSHLRGRAEPTSAAAPPSATPSAAPDPTPAATAAAAATAPAVAAAAAPPSTASTEPQPQATTTAKPTAAPTPRPAAHPATPQTHAPEATRPPSPANPPAPAPAPAPAPHKPAPGILDTSN